MREKFRDLAQRYCGMIPKDLKCTTWDEMQEKMADEIMEIVENHKPGMGLRVEFVPPAS